MPDSRSRAASSLLSDSSSPSARHEAHYGLGGSQSQSRRSSQVLGASAVRIQPRGSRVRFVRILALLCACSLSIGSHYASYILGPLKTRLSREMGTSNTEFSLLIAAFSLNSTWTPLIGGFLAGHLGTTLTSIIATSLIFSGQLVLLIGDITQSVRVMTLGMFIFGLGVSPLAVVQESIIVRFFKDHGLGFSMAIGLVAGKASSFVSARTSYPLSERFGPRAPFYASTLLAAFSFCMNLVYLTASKWFVRSSGTELEASELHAEAQAIESESFSEAEALKQVARKRKVRLRDITNLGDVFWAYIGINILCGAIWNPFMHLAPNIIQKRYELSESDASTKASYLLAGSVFLYPICGFFIDRMKHRPILHQLFIVSSIMTMMCYLWLSLPPALTGTPVPAIGIYALGQGFAPLLLVVLVPTLVSNKYVPTTLGAHKSLEQTGTTIFQTFAGLLLDTSKAHKAQIKILDVDDASDAEKASIGKLLYVFLFLNVCHPLSIIGLWTLDRRRKREAAEAARQALLASAAEEDDFEFESEDVEVEGSSPKTHRRSVSFAKETLPEAHGLQRRELSLSTVTVAGVEGSAAGQQRSSSAGLPGENAAEVETPVDADAGREEEERPLLGEEPLSPIVQPPIIGEAQTKAERVRGEVFGALAVALIAFAWVFFIGTAFLRLRAKKDRE